ncbi:MAG: hypothetical protein V1800_14660 [Candidatus Latescibacterota bacterium]
MNLQGAPWFHIPPEAWEAKCRNSSYELHGIWDSRDDVGRVVSSSVSLCRLTLDKGPWTDTQKMALIR